MGKDAFNTQSQIPPLWPQVRLKKADFEGDVLFGCSKKEIPCTYTSPNEYFNAKFPECSEKYGPAIMEITYLDQQGFARVIPLEVNDLFFAGALGGQPELGHKVVHHPDGFYYFDPRTGTFHITSEDKLQNLLSAWFVQCASSMPSSVAIQTLFVEFRKPEKLKAIVERAKSLLAVDESFFGGSLKRVGGIENEIRIVRAFYDEAIYSSADHNLNATAAYQKYLAFCASEKRTTMDRKDFLKVLGDIIREEHGISIRRDLKDDNGRDQEGWKGLALGFKAQPQESVSSE